MPLSNPGGLSAEQVQALIDAKVGVTIHRGGYATTVTAGATTTLTASSAYEQYFTGTNPQTIVLPVTSTLYLGFSFLVTNNSGGALVLQSSGANIVRSVQPGESVLVTCILTSGTTATSWNVQPISRGVIGYASTDDNFAHYISPNATPEGVIASVTPSGGGIYTVAFTSTQPDQYYRVIVTLGAVGFARVPQASKLPGSFEIVTAGQDGIDADVTNMEITVLR